MMSVLFVQAYLVLYAASFDLFFLILVILGLRGKEQSTQVGYNVTSSQ